jgi:tetratricopeptide (TPR) repeat protein
MVGTSAPDRRLAAIGAAAASVLRSTDYHAVRADDVAAAVRLPSDRSHDGRSRSAVWLYNEVKSRRVLVALAAFHAWQEFRRRSELSIPSTPSTIGTVGEARAAMAAALGEVVRFHRAEAPLMTQVGRGLGDIATSEKRSRAGSEAAQSAPEWPESPWGRVAAHGWRATCSVFADFLAPVMRAATAAVTWVDPADLQRSAVMLSDLAFRAARSDPDGPADRLGAALAAYWFERDLVGCAGTWVQDLDAAERCLAATQRRGTDPRAEAAAHGVVTRVLLEAGTLFRRAAKEIDQLAAETERVLPGRSAGQPDVEALCDATSRLGLALLRWGDLDRAKSAFTRSRSIAEDRLGNDASRIARVDSNLAELMCLADRPEAGLELAQRTRQVRAQLLDDAREEAERAAAWRRLTLTDQVCALAACRAGRVAEAVVLATRLVEDRRAHLGGADNINTAEAQILLGETLLEAGHPGEATFQLQQAHRIRRGRPAASGLAAQHDLVCLARAALDGGDGGAGVAARLLADAPARSPWFAERVSFRLGYEARRWHARAQAAGGDAGGAAELLCAGLDQLADQWALPADDPLVRAYLRDLGEVRLRGGDAEAAWACLVDVRDREEADPAIGAVDQIRTLVLLGRCAEQLRDDKGWEAAQRRIADLADRVAPTHPVLLANRHAQAAREVATGQLDVAAQLLAPVLEWRPLAHGRPALGEGHQLLRAARQLAARAGLAEGPPAANRGHDLPLADI